MSHMWMSHVTYANESLRHAASCVKQKWQYVWRPIQMHVVESCHVCEWGSVKRMNESSCHTTSCVCNTLQHTATHCNTLQHTATHCNTLWMSHHVTRPLVFSRSGNTSMALPHSHTWQDSTTYIWIRRHTYCHFCLTHDLLCLVLGGHTSMASFSTVCDSFMSIHFRECVTSCMWRSRVTRVWPRFQRSMNE